MNKLQLTQKDYTICGQSYQLKLPLNIEYMIPKDDSVRLLSQTVEELDLKELYQTYSRTRENYATPRQMLKVILYAYMNHIYTSPVGIRMSWQKAYFWQWGTISTSYIIKYRMIASQDIFMR